MLGILFLVLALVAGAVSYVARAPLGALLVLALVLLAAYDLTTGKLSGPRAKWK